MTLSIALFNKAITPQRTWRREDAFDAMFMVRLLLAVVVGTALGVIGIEGGMYFFGFFALTFVVGKWWVDYQEINLEEIEAVNGQHDYNSPSLLTENLGPSIPVFLLCWVTFYTTFHSS